MFAHRHAHRAPHAVPPLLTACSPRRPAHLCVARRCRAEADAACRRRCTSSSQLREQGQCCRAAREEDELSTSPVQETAALDQLIDLLTSARSPQNLAQLVAENIIALDQKFWIRLAARADLAATREDKDRLKSLANAVMKITDEIMKRSSSQLADSARILQEILAAAANERGEWHMPLSAEKLTAMRKAMEARAARLDEALLSNAYAWMRKSHDDGLDGMVALLQKALQTYASLALSGAAAPRPRAAGNGASGVAAAKAGATGAVLERVLAADEGEWEALLGAAAAAGEPSAAALKGELQKRMEALVLTLPAGSYAQRVQAEYLKELESRIEQAYSSKGPEH